MKWVVAFVLLAGCGATQVKVEPVKIQPIHITVDVNLNEGEKPAEKPAEK